MSYKVTIIGGGSSTFTPQLMQMFLASKVLQGSTIVLMDIDALPFSMIQIQDLREGGSEDESR